MPAVRYLAEELVEVRDWLDRSADAIGELESLLPTAGPARRLTVRALSAGVLLSARHDGNVHLTNVMSVLSRLSPDDQLLLRIELSAVTQRQVDDLWAKVARSLDPHLLNRDGGGLDARERRVRDARCARITDAFLAATVPTDATPSSSSAHDATNVQAWALPPTPPEVRGRTSSADKQRRKDANKKQGRPAFVPKYPPGSPYHSSTAAWIGNDDPRKVLFGHGFHLLVSVAELNGSALDLPLLCRSARLVPAPTPGASIGVDLVARFKAMRDRDPDVLAGERPALADVLADGGYSGAAAGSWLLPVKALGGRPVFALHGGNQEGLRNRSVQAKWVDGRPYCPCMPARLDNLTYPRWPHQRHLRDDWRRERAERDPFELRTNGAVRADGGRQFKMPHRGGCEVCRSRPPGERCCRSATVLFGATELACYQDTVHGTVEWALSYARRSRVEGFNGVLKEVTGLRRGNVRFFEHGKLTLGYVMLAVAANLRLVSSWRRRLEVFARVRATAAGRPKRRASRSTRTPISAFLPGADFVMPDTPDPVDPPEKSAKKSGRRARAPDPLGFLHE